MSRLHYQFQIKGTSPLRTHNVQLADPANFYAQQISPIARKGSKRTEAETLALYQLEALGGMYLDPSGKITLPGRVIHGAMRAAESKKGKDSKRKSFEAYVRLPLYLKFTFSGEQDPAKRSAMGEYRNLELVGSQGSRGGGKTVRSRPLFDDWTAEGELIVEDEGLDPDRVESALRAAGHAGIGESFGGYGQFTITEWQAGKIE